MDGLGYSIAKNMFSLRERLFHVLGSGMIKLAQPGVTSRDLDQFSASRLSFAFQCTNQHAKFYRKQFVS